MLYFSFNRQNTYTTHIANLATILFLMFIKQHFSTNAQNTLHLNRCTHLLRLVMDCRTLSKVGCNWFSRQQKFRW